MKVVSCNPSQTEVSPKMYNACAFEVIDKWNPKQHAKTCDTMFYLSDGTGAYVWNCEEWIFLRFAGGPQPDWKAKENEPGGIKNKPFEKLGNGLVVSKEGVLSVSITPEDIGAQRKLVEGTGITIDCTDKENPVISVSGEYASESELKNHIEDTNNPHKVTAELVGAYSKIEADEKYSKKEDLMTHVKDKDNPHEVTAGQTGAFTKEESSANVIYQVIGKEKAEITFRLDAKSEFVKVSSVGYTTLLSPTNVSWTPLTEEQLNNLSSLDGSLYSARDVAANYMKQLKYDCDILGFFKSLLGEKFFTIRGATTDSQKVEVLESLITDFTSNVYGYGSGGGINKLTHRNWNGTWTVSDSTAANEVTRIGQTIESTDTNWKKLINGGKISVLSNSEPTISPNYSTVNIDYLCLDVTIELSANEHFEYMIAAYHVENPPVLAEEKESGLVVMKTTKVSNQDWNTLTETGVYSVGQGTGPNSPTGTTATWGYLVVYRRSTDWLEQAYYSSGAMYRRVLQGDPLIWSSWIKMASQSDLKWSNLSDKPFETIGENLEVVDGKLNASGAPDLSGFVTTETDQTITGSKEFEVGPTVNGEKLMTRTMGFKSYSHRYNHLLTGDMTTYLSEMESVFFRRSNFVEYYGRFNVKTAGAMKGTIVTHPIPIGYRQAALTSGPIWNIPFRVCQFTFPQGNYLAMYEGNNVRIYSDKAGNHYVYGSWYTEDAPPV